MLHTHLPPLFCENYSRTLFVALTDFLCVFFARMYALNLPQFDYKLKRADGKVWIFDSIRKKFIVLTPEEWVRQHFVNYLIAHCGYPRTLVRIEGGLHYNQMQRRSDIVVFDRQGSPWMVVECKAPTEKISATTLGQASAYNSTLKATYLAVTNGRVHFCARIDWEQRTTAWMEKSLCRQP